MATRGSAILILENEVLIGPEFNGDMYPERFGGHGDNFLKLLSEVNNNVDFIKMNNSFNKHNFGYEKIMSHYQGKFDNSEFIIEDVYHVDKMMKLDDLYLVTSDWMFIKNKSEAKINLKDVNGNIITLENNESIRLHFGRLKSDNDIHRIKAS